MTRHLKALLPRVGCDEDGWMVKVNDEPTYPHFFHQVSVANIQRLEVSGQADISYVGFGPSDLTPAPPVGFNLTFICPEGQVFDHDWFATPFIMMTCQVKIMSCFVKNQLTRSTFNIGSVGNDSENMNPVVRFKTP